MIDELFDRDYQTGRANLNKGIETLVGQLRDAIVPAFLAIHRFEWDAPWDRGPRQKTQN